MRVEIKDGKLTTEVKDGIYTIKKHVQNRSISQNNALHMYFDHLATALNDAGFDMKKTLRPELDIPWTAYSCKESLWRPLQLAMTGKKSTTQITTEDINKILDVLSREIGSRTGVVVDFPSIEYLMQELS